MPVHDCACELFHLILGVTQDMLSWRCRGRYPSFVDALRDLDDPLTLVHLFATLPAEALHNIPAKAVATSRRLALEWQAWVVRTSALRRTFVSVKGFYFQADVMGQPVTWLVPHATSQVRWVLPPPSFVIWYCHAITGGWSICWGYAPDALLQWRRQAICSAFTSWLQVHHGYLSCYGCLMTR